MQARRGGARAVQGTKIGEFPQPRRKAGADGFIGPQRTARPACGQAVSPVGSPRGRKIHPESQIAVVGTPAYRRPGRSRSSFITTLFASTRAPAPISEPYSSIALRPIVAPAAMRT